MIIGLKKHLTLCVIYANHHMIEKFLMNCQLMIRKQSNIIINIFDLF
jgi:hypothetical protein